VVDGSLILWPSASTASSASLPDIPAAPNANTCALPRYVLVNDANLKIQAHCAQCGTEIGQGYVRAIGSRSVFCALACYLSAAEKLVPRFGGSSANLFAASPNLSAASQNLFAASQCQSETK
jgi:hypothetical protein